MTTIYRLDDVLALTEQNVGSKAWSMAKLRQQGIVTPPGFCVTTLAYHEFITRNQLQEIISQEFGRKAIQAMRWEELWDAAFRIRTAFTKAPFSENFLRELTNALQEFPTSPFAVRSSGIGEDGLHLSYAGLFASILHCKTPHEIAQAIKEVFASLWSSAAMMYRHELKLDFTSSAMAVLIQPMIYKDTSGIIFSQDPRTKNSDNLIIESIHGRTFELVTHHREPDHFELQRSNGQLVSEKFSADGNSAISAKQLESLWQNALTIEKLLGYPVDIEWTGLDQEFTVLQARPITRLSHKTVDDRHYFLTLTLSNEQLRALGSEVATQLIPQLTALGEQYNATDLEALDDSQLSNEIADRQAHLHQWRSIYKFKFVPLSHAVRALAELYETLIHPDDPYEFIELLLHEDRLAKRRNQILSESADLLQKDPILLEQLSHPEANTTWQQIQAHLSQAKTGQLILEKLHELNNQFFDVNFHTERLIDHPDIPFGIIVKMAQQAVSHPKIFADKAKMTEKFLLTCQGEQRARAVELLELARLSWRIRDDDDLLMGRIESQLLRAIQTGLQRLYQQKKIIEIPTNTITLANGVSKLLKTIPEKPIKFILDAKEQPREHLYQETKAQRFLRGVPAAPGIVIGKIRKIQTIDDIRAFQPGEILACEFIDPVMTHLLLLAGGIIESRGGMLVHSVIIAREIGIPCVNGIANMLENIENGALVEVNGSTGVVSFLDQP